MKIALWLVLVLSAFLMLTNLGGGSLSSWDEAFYAEVSREMMLSGNLMELTWSGSDWYDKPPLYMWVTNIFYKIFGVNEFSARLFSALSGIGVIIVTFLFSRRLFSPRVGLLAAIILLSTYHFAWFSRMGHLDVTFTFFCLCSIYSFVLSEEKPVWLMCSAFWLALAFMTKGAAIFTVPAAIMIYVFVRRKPEMLLNRYTLFGLVIFSIVGLSWFIAEYIHYGQVFIDGHFAKHMVSRSQTSMDGHAGTWLTYINAVLYKGKPWEQSRLYHCLFSFTIR